jgi:hypothetical protein
VSVSRIRHFVSFHNPEVLGVGFKKVTTWSVLANKRVRDLNGDFVWMVGREPEGTDFFLFGRFRVDADGPGNHADYKYRISGSSGLWIKPAVKLNELPWFALLLQKSSNFNNAFLAVTDEEILDGLRHVVHPPAVVA